LLGLARPADVRSKCHTEPGTSRQADLDAVSRSLWKS
jgi:hypothetical protein